MTELKAKEVDRKPADTPVLWLHTEFSARTNTRELMYCPITWFRVADKVDPPTMEESHSNFLIESAIFLPQNPPFFR